MVDDSLLEPDRVIAGRYSLVEKVGAGGVGEVWRARHLALGVDVAIKFLHAPEVTDEDARRRFLNEAQITAQLKTRHAVQVFDYGVTEQGIPFLVMEYLDGETLAERLYRGPLTPEQTIKILIQAARALHRAHAMGIVHRDFKPDNILLVVDEEGREQVKVFDFGLAKLLGCSDVAALDLRDGPVDPPLTRNSTVVGTPCYMAPEQIRDAGGVDHKADIWAFGCVAYECLTGMRAFDARTLSDLFHDIERGRYIRATQLDKTLPAGFDDWMQIACATDTSQRFGSVRTAMHTLVICFDMAAQVANAPDETPGGSGPLARSIADETHAPAPAVAAPPASPRKTGRRWPMVLAAVLSLAAGAASIAAFRSPATCRALAGGHRPVLVGFAAPLPAAVKESRAAALPPPRAVPVPVPVVALPPPPARATAAVTADAPPPPVLRPATPRSPFVLPELGI
jgi:serine/threonine-protein kinase